MEPQPAVIYAITRCGSDAQLDQQRLCSKFSSLSWLDIMFWNKTFAVFQIAIIIMCILYVVLWTRKGAHTQIDPWVENSTAEPPDHSSSDMRGRFLISLFCSDLNLCFVLTCCFFVQSQNKQAFSLVEIKNLYDSSPSFTVFPFLWFSHHLCLGKLPFNSWFLTPHHLVPPCRHSSFTCCFQC